MDKPTHYVEIRVLPLDGEMLSGGDVALVTAKIMAAVHLHIVDGHDIAVSFPKYQTKTVKDDNGRVMETVGTGNLIRVFGDANALMAFVVRPDVAHLIGAAACSVGKAPIKSVPETSEWEVFSRFRGAERDTAAYIERSGRRLASRIEAGRSKMGMSDLAVRAEKLSQDLGRKLPPYVNMESSSTGKRFRLFVDRKSVSEFVSKKPSTYGLGVTVPRF
jgi:CRISPR-associated protein Cas6/Csy4, subtype I-F/YPEST